MWSLNQIIRPNLQYIISIFVKSYLCVYLFSLWAINFNLKITPSIKSSQFFHYFFAHNCTCLWHDYALPYCGFSNATFIVIAITVLQIHNYRALNIFQWLTTVISFSKSVRQPTKQPVSQSTNVHANIMEIVITGNQTTPTSQPNGKPTKG